MNKKNSLLLQTWCVCVVFVIAKAGHHEKSRDYRLHVQVVECLVDIVF